MPPKAFSPITVTLTQDPKNFQFADNVLDQNTFLGWCLAVEVQAGQSLITSISYNANRSRYSGTALFKQLKMMVAAMTEVCG